VAGRRDRAAVAVTIGAVTGLDAAGLNRFVATFIGIAAGIAVLALLRFTNLGNRQHDPATDPGRCRQVS
jgi:hypothetical protein